MNIHNFIHAEMLESSALSKQVHLLSPHQESLLSTNSVQIAPNRLFAVKNVDHAEDISSPFAVRIFDVYDNLPGGEILTLGGISLIRTIKIELAIPEELIASTYKCIKQLPNEYYEIFPSNHNINSGFHFPDPFGEPTCLLDLLEQALAPTIPPVNHNKVSSKTVDKFGLDELHVDSFEGMRLDETGQRQAIWRYFLNLGSENRTTVVSPMNPLAIDHLMPLEYTQNFLDPLFAAADKVIPLLLLTTPGFERHQDNVVIYGVKICTTHLLHGEYGKKDDFLAIINSLE